MAATRLEKAQFSQAKLRNVHLVSAKLQDANLRFAKLQDANLHGANLQGADLHEAKLQAAKLAEAERQGANLYRAELQGADLVKAELQGADLVSAKLQGADLSAANLQGATLGGADLQRTDLRGVDAWLASFPTYGYFVQSPAIGVARLRLSPPTTQDKAKLKKSLQADITGGKLLARVIERLDPILRDVPPACEDEDKWKQLRQAPEPSPGELVPFLADLACGDRGGYIAKSMALRVPPYAKSRDRPQFAQPLAKALLDEKCEGAKALTDEMRTMLENLVAETE